MARDSRETPARAKLLARAPLGVRERRWWLLGLSVAAVLGVILRWPAVEIGQLSDDYMQYAMIQGLYPGDGYAPFDLYAFVREDIDLAVHVDKGTVPWFAEPDFHGTVFRPLSSLLLWLDHTLAPGAVRLWHVHSLLWFAACVFSFGLCARRLLPRWPAMLAVALLICEAAFVSPLGWLANRCVLVSAAFGFAVIFVHLEWRRPDPDTPSWLRRHGPWIELLSFALCLAGGEYGLGIAAYVLAWELFVGGRSAGAPADAWSVRARALLPVLTVLGAYMALHVGLGYGTFGADVYADPIHAPLGWFKWAKLRIPKLCTGALWSLPASSVTVFYHPGASWWQAFDPASDAIGYHLSHARLGWFGIALGAVALGLARAGLHVDERRVLRAVLFGALLGLLPVSVAPAHSRLLVVAQLGACVAVALIVVACLRLLLRRDPARLRARELGEGEQGRAPWIGRLRGAALLPLVLALLASHVILDLRWNQRYLLHLGGMHTQNALAFTKGDLLRHELAGREVVVLNGPSQTVGMYGHFVLHANGAPAPATWRSLALGGHHPIFVSRRDERTLELTAIDGAWLQTAGELFFRRAEKLLSVGDRFDYPGLAVEILAVEDGFPTQVRFRFPHNLDDPRYLFLTSTKAGLMEWQVPPVGGRAVVPFPGLPAPEGRPAFPEARRDTTGPK